MNSGKVSFSGPAQNIKADTRDKARPDKAKAAMTHERPKAK